MQFQVEIEKFAVHRILDIGHFGAGTIFPEPAIQIDAIGIFPGVSFETGWIDTGKDVKLPFMEKRDE